MRNAIYRDNRDRLRASSEVFPSMLADFLETDVRENPGWCEELLRGLDQAWGGERFEAYGKMCMRWRPDRWVPSCATATTTGELRSGSPSPI